jgi:hypothetical protein
MSRTYKDQPWPVQGRRLRNKYYVSEVHRDDCRYGGIGRRWVGHVVGNEPCNIDDFKYNPNTREFWQNQCYRTFYYYYYGGIPTEYVNHMYHRPERRRVKDAARKAVTDYNGNGSSEYDIPSWQARNSCRWLYW